MDVFKLAFETIVVGLLSFVWLALAVDLLFPTFFAEDLAKIDAKYQSAIGVGLLTLAYCFGSAIMPVAGQLMNDEHWPFSESTIRCWVMVELRWRLSQVDGATDLLKTYTPAKDFLPNGRFTCRSLLFDIVFQQGKTGDAGELTTHLEPFWRHSKTYDEKRPAELLTTFSVYESKVVADLSDKNDSFRQLHERIIVLRGAVINGALLFVLCFFRVMARTDAEKIDLKVLDRIWIKTVLGCAIAVVLTLLAIRCGSQDLGQPDIFDIPVLEILFGSATVFGGFWVIKGVPYRSFMNKRTVFISLFLVLIAYGGWLWSEVQYDQQIILAVATAQKTDHP